MPMERSPPKGNYQRDFDQMICKCSDEWKSFNKAQIEKEDVNTFPNLNVNQSLRITLTLNKLGHLEVGILDD